VTEPAPRSSIEARTTAVVLVLVLLVTFIAIVGLRALGIGRHRPAVALIGDSITANLDATAHRELGDDYALTIDGKPGFLVDQQLPAVTNAARFPFDQIIVNLGTNDVMTSDHDLGETSSNLAQIADVLSGVRCVHLVTVSEEMVNSTNDAGVRAQRVNDSIRAIASTHPNVRVIDWASLERDYERDHGEIITSDTVHPNDVGNKVLAGAYGESLDACAG
jgi:hypothetical protein